MRFLKRITTIILLIILVQITGCKKKAVQKETAIILVKDTVKQNKTYRLRKYGHVKKLYKRLATPVTKLCIQYQVPPGAVLSIISLESGWGNGYIGKITGNFLSLNAVGKDAELPALFLPSLNDKSKRILFDKNEISTIDSTKITWMQREASLKKDYRPAPYTGTSDNLEYFQNHPAELTKANLKNVEDFVKRFISSTSKIKAYREARELLDTEIKVNGIGVLFDNELNKKFIHTIGGKPNSFNFRETWPKKVLSIMHGVGAVKLSKDLHNNIPFDKAWKQ